MSKVQIETVRVLRRARLPIHKDDEINLHKAFNDLKQCDFELRYDPNSGIKALYVKIGGMSFRVFSNGTVMIFGTLPIKKQEEILIFFWKQHLHQFVLNHNSYM